MSVALSANADAGDATPDKSLDRALALLQETLEIVDSSDAPPEIGARIQEVIDSIERLPERGKNA